MPVMATKADTPTSIYTILAAPSGRVATRLKSKSPTNPQLRPPTTRSIHATDFNDFIISKINSNCLLLLIIPSHDIIFLIMYEDVDKKEIPEEIKGWNWGAFLFNWIWGIGNKTYIALFSLVPIVGIVMMFYLGFKGNELAWKNNDWKSIEDFKYAQKKWSTTSIAVIIIFILFVLIFFK
ncbi:MAG: hypothetical protein ACI9GH_000402 [Candidatus Paceibacteria bacterium]|jgi:hypothetical protein